MLPLTAATPLQNVFLQSTCLFYCHTKPQLMVLPTPVYWWWQRRQSGLKTGGGVRESRFENGGPWVITVPQTEAHSTGLRVSSPKFLFNYTQIILFLKSPPWPSLAPPPSQQLTRSVAFGVLVSPRANNSKLCPLKIADHRSIGW